MEAILVNDIDFETANSLEDIEDLREDVVREGDHITKRRKKRLTKKVAKGGKKGKKATKKLKKAAVRTQRRKLRKTVSLKERLIVAPLVPLRGVMERAVKKHGVDNPKVLPLAILAKEFFNRVVRKTNTYYEEIPDELCNYDNVEPVTLTAIVSAVVTFVKGLKKKKAAGEKLTKTEELVVSGTEKVETEIKEKAEEEAAKEVGMKMFEGKTWIYIAAGVILLILLVRSK